MTPPTHRIHSEGSWLSLWAMIAMIAAMCAPFLLVTIPPLIDVPGHIAAAGIEAAPSGSALHRYYDWHWSPNLNLGGEIVMKLLGGGLMAGWWTSVIATAAFVGGCLSVIRTLNPRGAYGLGWAVIFALGFPWLWGFLNFLLAAGFAMLAFAASERLDDRPARRAMVLIVAQPVVMLCHSIGGLLLAVLVVGAAIGDVWDRSKDDGTAPIAALWRRCWPLAVTVAIVATWMAAKAGGPPMVLAWDWHDKLSFLNEVLRDQNRVVDRWSEGVSYAILLFGWLAGARWSRRQGAVFAAVLVFYAILPARIGPSEAIDTRFLPLVLLVGLGLQDWRGARPLVRAVIASTGGAVLAVRLFLIAIGFAHDAAGFTMQLRALDHVTRGSRIYVIRGHACDAGAWRRSRLDTLPALASPLRDAWINTQWALPGLDMLRFRYRAEPAGTPGVPSMVRPAACAIPAEPTLAAVLPRIPYDRVDYLWLLDTGQPDRVDRRLTRVWQWRDSALYRTDAD